MDDDVKAELHSVIKTIASSDDPTKVKGATKLTEKEKKKFLDGYND